MTIIISPNSTNFRQIYLSDKALTRNQLFFLLYHCNTLFFEDLTPLEQIPKSKEKYYVDQNFVKPFHSLGQKTLGKR